MGVVIRAYSSINLLDATFDKEEEEATYRNSGRFVDIDFVVPKVLPQFPGAADDIVGDGVYGYSKSTIMASMSCSGYNDWRREILAAHKIREFEDSDFMELINFSDCEGAFGSATCVALANTFKRHHTWAQHPGRPFWFYPVYKSMMDGFIAAGERGMVCFS